MAKKKDVNVDELDEDSGKSGKFVSILVAILIIAIWLVFYICTAYQDECGRCRKHVKAIS